MAKAMTTMVKILTIMMMMVNNARPSSTLLGKLIRGRGAMMKQGSGKLI